MPTAQSILEHKDGKVATIGTDATVREAATLMNERHIGSLVVTNGDKVVGIFTERDILNRVVAEEKMPEKTREELRDDGFFITGDLGRIDEFGYLQIVGRNKDLIISGGYNIYPKEIELVLDDLPGVLESAVIGAPHPDFGESVIGILVADGDQSLNLDAIEEALGKSLARFKQPRKLFVTDGLPRNTMGKVQKNILRDTFGSTFQD